MRKFLSVIMVIAMLATSILPAIANVAAADADTLVIDMSSVGFVENEDGTVSAKVDLAFTNNPGFVDLSLFVYYNNTEVGEGDDVAADAYADYAAIGAGKRSTLTAVKKYFTAAGVATGASIFGKQIDINCYDPETGDPVLNTATGTFATLEFTAEEFSADMLANIGMFIVDEVAYDADGNEVATEVATPELAVTAKPEDPYATKYDVESFPADQFVINVTGTKVFENGFVDGEAKTADVNVEFYGNNAENNPFGVWGYRAFLYYPAELSTVAYANGEIFKDTEMQKFEDCATNVDVAEELAKDTPHSAITPALKAFDYVGYETYAEDGIKISIIQHLGTNWYDVTLGDGVLETVTFQLPDDAAAGDKWEIGICAAADDPCYNGGSTPEDQHPELQPAPIDGVVYNNGYIEVISVKEESFEDFTFSAEDIVISADNKTATVNVYVSGNNAEVNPYGFWSARLYFYYPTELKLTDVDEGKIVPTGGFTLGNFNFDLVSASKDPAQANNAVVKGAPLAFADKGFDWENEDFRLTTVYFEYPETIGGITKNGHYATLTFEIPEGAVAGDSWNVGIATCYDNADVIGYVTDPETTPAERLTHALDDGSITLGGDAVVEPEPPVHEHELQYTAGVEAGCHYIGNTEYWYCAGCDTVFADEAATQITNRKNVIIPAKGSDLLVHMDAVEAGCHYNGNVEYWVCYECEQVWTDEALTQLTNIKNVIIPATGSENLVHVEAKAPTFAEDGNIEYWYCEDCEQVWQDEALTQLTNFKNVIIPALTQATVSVGTASAIKGDNAEVAITIANNPGLFIAKFVVTYDASVLTLVEATNGDVFADEFVIINTDVEGQITIYLENAELADAAANGVLANLVFATDANGDPAEVELAIEAVEAINVAGEDVAIEVVAGKVSVINCTHEGKEITEVITKNATVFEEGIIEYVCECGEVVNTATIAKLAGIEIGEWQIATVGERQAYAVNLLNNPGVWSLSVKVAYDAYCLEFVQVDSVLFTADEYSYSVADGVVTIYVEAADLNNITEDGSAFYIVFDTVMCGYSDLDVELVAENTINAAGENVAFECIDGSTRINCALTHSPFVAPSDVNGWQEFWYCEYCGAMYADAQGRFITNRMNCYIPANSISVSEETAGEGAEVEVAVNLDSNYGIWSLGLKVTFDADALTLKGINSGLFQIDENSYSVEDGVITIFVENAEIADVTDTGAAFYLVFEGNVAGEYEIAAELIADNTINAAGENVVFAVANGSLVIDHVCDLEYNAPVEASCHQTGMQEYWYCADCDSVYADAEGRYLTNRKNLTIPATAEIKYVEAVEATCHQNGSAAYYYCTECDAVFDEDFVLTNRKNLTIPHTAEIIHVDAVEAVCHQTGNVEYWYCSECNAVFTDAALTQLSNFKNVIVPAPVELTYVAATEATCTENGNTEYWYCAECDAVFADAMGAVITNRLNVTIPSLGHVAGDKVVTVEPTVDAEGAWEIRCTVCGELLESGTIEKISFITKASGTDYVKSVSLEGNVITVVARPNAPYVKIAVGYNEGTTVASANTTMIRSTYAYLIINNGETATIVATAADGTELEYTVVVEWIDEFYTSYVGGYTTENVEVSEDIFNVYVKTNMNNASIGFVLTEGTTYEASAGLQAVLSGGKVYFKALKADDNTYTVTFTTRAGAVKVVTINFIYDYAEVEGAQGGYMVDGLTLEAGNVINITANEAYGYASFRFVLKNTTSSIAWDEETVDAVVQFNIHWFKIYNDGTDYVTKTFVVTNNANGVVDTYTVNVTFGSDN